MNTQEKNQNTLKVKLNARDKELLEAIKPIVDGIAKIVGTNCEVLLHSLGDISHSTIHIQNGNITGRMIGSPLTDFRYKSIKGIILKRKDTATGYTIQTLKDGKRGRELGYYSETDGEYFSTQRVLKFMRDNSIAVEHIQASNASRTMKLYGATSLREFMFSYAEEVLSKEVL